MSSALNPLGLPEEKTRVAVKDKSNPQSVVNIIPSMIATKVAAIPDELFDMRADEIAAKFRKERKDERGKVIYSKETEIEEKLRISFWREYDRAVDRGTMMSLERICSGVCHTNTLRQISNNTFKMLYILTPPDDYVTTMQELLTIGLDQLRDIILQPHVDEKGQPNARMCDVKMRIIDTILTRVKGAVTHRMETKNLNYNVEQEIKAGDLSALTDPAEIDRRLKELLSGETSTTEAIDVTPKKDG